MEQGLNTKELKDEAAERLLKLVRRKESAGDGVVEPGQVRGGGEDTSDVIDLMEILKQRLQGIQDEPAGAASTADGEDLEESSRAEPYARAKALDIPGRSGMSRDQLVKAIRRSA